MTAINDPLSYLSEAPNETGSPERMLLLAILERAILDFVGNDVKEAECASEWLLSNEDFDNNEPFTFAWVCRELDLSPKMVSDTIKAMPKRGSNRIAPWYFARKAEWSNTDRAPVSASCAC